LSKYANSDEGGTTLTRLNVGFHDSTQLGLTWTWTWTNLA